MIFKTIINKMVLEAIKNLPKKNITARDREYLSLVGLGYTNSEIGGILTVKDTSPKKTFEKVFSKLNARNRANAALIAYIHGIITSELMIKMEIKAQEFFQAHPEYRSKKVSPKRL